MKSLMWLVVVVSVSISVSVGGRASAQDTYQVGVAAVDITPDYPIRLNGFGNRRDESTGVSQKIWAKAIAISQADEPPAVIIAIDSLGVRLPMVDEVARRLHEQFQIPREKVMLTFSHSHCTPKVNGACDNIFSTPIPAPHQAHIDQYTQELTDKIAEVAIGAVQKRAPGTLHWSVGKVGFAKNRRRAGGPVDHDLPVLIVRDPQGKVRAITTSYACHCVTLSFNEVSGDWSGYAQQKIEELFPGAIALVSIGCGSDSNPTSGVTGDKVDVAAEQGAEIAREVARLAALPGTALEGPLRAQLDYLELPLNGPPTREELQKLADAGGPAGYNAQTQLARLDRNEPLLTAIHYPVQSLSFGTRLHMVFLAGEVCVDYSLRLKQELAGDRIWTNGYSNDFCAYIPSERLVREGGYGGGGETPYFALPSTLQAGLEDKIVAAVKEQAGEAFLAVPGTQGVAPKTPDESLKCLHTHPRLRVELVVAEPLVQDPVAIDFGLDGQLWVAEMTDYARGVNDDFTPRGRVRLVTDADEDGQYDRATEFLDGLRFPTEVKVWKRGVLICDAPDILYAEDTDGDGKADIRRTLFSGFATHNPHARVNSLRAGLDGWVYGSGGLFGGKITNAAGTTVDVTNRDFRMKPDEGVIEAIAGSTQQGRPRDDWGNWFGCTNGSLLFHHVLEDPYIRRNPLVVPPPPTRFVPNDPAAQQQLFPRGDLVLFKLSGVPGRPTSACGAEIYRDEFLGDDFAGNAFTCEPVNQLVHRRVLERKGVTFTGLRPEEEQEQEFLASTDRWFRPVQCRTGPDGSLWVVDMYRYVIEHPQWIPPETIAELNVLAGQGKGRIYRVLPKDSAARMPPRLSKLASKDLAAAMDSTNGVQRDLVQEHLIERADADAATVNVLETLARSSVHPAVRVQAASTLAGLHALKPEVVATLATHEHPEVRRNALRLSEPWLNESAELRAHVLRGAEDPAAEVRLQAAYSLGACDHADAATALVRLGSRADADAYLQAAALSSMSNDRITAALQIALAAEAPSNTFVESLLTMAASSRDEAAVAEVIASIAAAAERRGIAATWSALAKVMDVAERNVPQWSQTLSSEGVETLQRMISQARTVLGDERSADADRLAALRWLGRPAESFPAALRSGLEGLQGDLVQLLGPRHQPDIQVAATRAVAAAAGVKAPELLLATWPDATPRLRGELLATLFARPAWIEAVLDAMEAGVMKTGDLDAVRREQLLTHADAKIRARVESLFASTGDSSRAELIAAWSEVATREADAGRGREVFQKRCAACHQLDSVGFQVGPDLAALTNRSSQALLIAILDPNRDVDGRYVNYVAALGDGRTLTGLLMSESANSVTLREQGGKDHTLLRSDLDELRATGRSAMPEGLEKDVTQQEVADLIAYLQPPRVAPKKFVGNVPQPITPDGQGEWKLPATAAEIFGGDIAFESESPYRNIGYWHGATDYAGWQVTPTAPQKVDVYLDYSCAPESAGNGFLVEGLEVPLRGTVPSTGAWSQYRILRVGTAQLPAGRTYITVRFDGTPRRTALFDLRTIYFVPAGAQPTAFTATGEPASMPTTPEEIARFLLDDQQPAAARQELIAKHPQHAGAIIAAMTADLPNEAVEEYRRIPWIWRVAIAAGKRNEPTELLDVLKVSMPQLGQPLRDWQSVAIGGGIINGITQAGAWPKERIEPLLKVEGLLVARWQRAIELASAMADDEKVPQGTRYDALRMIAMSTWDQRGRQMEKYLRAGAPDELQMGAVSGAADMPQPAAAAALLAGMPHYSPRNRALAMEGMVRSADRCLMLLEAIQQGKVPGGELDPAHSKRLLEHSDARVREQAMAVLRPN